MLVYPAWGSQDGSYRETRGSQRDYSKISCSKRQEDGAASISRSWPRKWHESVPPSSMDWNSQRTHQFSGGGTKMPFLNGRMSKNLWPSLTRHTHPTFRPRGLSYFFWARTMFSFEFAWPRVPPECFPIPPWIYLCTLFFFSPMDFKLLSSSICLFSFFIAP